MRFEKVKFETAGGDWKMAELCNQALDEVAKTLLVRIDHADFADSKIAFKYAVLRQSLTYRLIDLIEGTISAWSAGNRISAIVVGRAALESVAHIHSVETRMQTALEATDTKQLDDLAMRETFSAKAADYLLDPVFVATNILSALDRLDKEVPAVRKYYDTLSEYAHPNAKGHYFFYAKLDKEKMVTNFAQDMTGLKGTVRNVTSACLGIYWAQLSLKNIDEMIPKIADLQAGETKPAQ